MMNPADLASGILSGGVMPDPRKRGIGSFFADALKAPGAQKDMRELGASLFAKSQENRAPEAPGLTRGDASLVQNIGGKTPDQILAEYQALRQGYMANGGPVRMAGTANSGTLVQAFPAVGRAPTQEQAEEIKRLDELNVLESEAEGFRSLGLTPTEIEERRKQLEEIRAREAEAEAGTGQAQPRMFADDFRATPNQLFMAQREAERANAPKPLSAFEEYLAYLKERDKKLTAEYKTQEEQELARQQEAGGLPFLLRQLGIGMIATGGNLGEGLRGGLGQAFSAREEQTQAARDKIRELQLKQRINPIESEAEIQKLRYEAAVAADKEARTGGISKEKYFEEANKLESELLKALSENESMDPMGIERVRARIEYYRKLAGAADPTAGLGGLPSGVKVTRE